VKNLLDQASDSSSDNEECKIIKWKENLKKLVPNPDSATILFRRPVQQLRSLGRGIASIPKKMLQSKKKVSETCNEDAEIESEAKSIPKSVQRKDSKANVVPKAEQDETKRMLKRAQNKDEAVQKDRANLIPNSKLEEANEKTEREKQEAELARVEKETAQLEEVQATLLSAQKEKELRRALQEEANLKLEEKAKRMQVVSEKNKPHTRIARATKKLRMSGRRREKNFEHVAQTCMIVKEKAW
jgi:hypothetical protein